MVPDWLTGLSKKKMSTIVLQMFRLGNSWAPVIKAKCIIFFSFSQAPFAMPTLCNLISPKGCRVRGSNHSCPHPSRGVTSYGINFVSCTKKNELIPQKHNYLICGERWDGTECSSWHKRELDVRAENKQFCMDRWGLTWGRLVLFFEIGFQCQKERKTWKETMDADGFTTWHSLRPAVLFLLSHLPCPSNGGRMREEATLQMMNLPSGLDPFRLNASSGPEPGLGI